VLLSSQGDNCEFEVMHPKPRGGLIEATGD
jgi:hypothetical protein